MHPSIANLVFGEHENMFLAYGIDASAFAQLNTPKRHALAAAITMSRSKRDKASLNRTCELVLRNGDGISLATFLDIKANKLPECFFKRITDPQLWSQKDYRGLQRLAAKPNILKILHHKKSLQYSDIAVLLELSEPWQKAKLLELVDSQAQARALVTLGAAIRFVSGREREEAFVTSLCRRATLDGLGERFWRFLYKDQRVTSMPLNSAASFERIVSEKQCRKIAQTGHCFGELTMIEAVLSSELLFYTWSGAKNAVISLERDMGNLGWFVCQACRPKSKPLTKRQMTQLENDLQQLQTKVSVFRWSRKIDSALRVLA